MRQLKNEIKIKRYDRCPKIKDYYRISIKVELTTKRPKAVYKLIEKGLLTDLVDEMPRVDLICKDCKRANYSMAYCGGGINQFNDKQRCGIREEVSHAL